MNRPEPDIWRDLAVLLAVGEAQSPLVAARALGMSQDAVTKRIDQLEMRVGSQLVRRDAGAWTLTQEGQDLTLRTRSIADLVERGGRSALDSATHPLILSCPELFFEHLLLPVWYRMQNRLPARPIQLRTGVSVTDQSLDGSDLSLCMGRALRPGVKGYEIGQVSFRLFAHRRLLAQKTQTPPSHFTVENPHFSVPDPFWPDLGPTRRVICPNLGMVAAAVKAGRGVGLLPGFVAQRDLALVPVGRLALPPFTLWIMCREGAAETAQITALRDLLRREIAPLLAEPKAAG